MTDTSLEWQDWGLAPITGTIWETLTSVIGPGSSLVQELSNADRETGIISLELDGGGPGQATFELYSARTRFPNPKAIARTRFTINDSVPTFVPVSFIAPSIFLNCLTVTIGTANLFWGYATINGRPNTIAMQVSSPSLNSAGTIVAGDTAVISPAACIPGVLALYLTTTASDYDVYLRTWNANVVTDTLLGNDSSPIPIGLPLTTPLGSFAIVIANNDATDSDYTLLGIYQP